jgi:hypothetical protein
MVDFALSESLLGVDVDAYISHVTQALTARYENLARNLVGLDVLINAYQVIVRSNMDACVIEHAVTAYTCALSAWLSDVDVCARDEETLRCGLDILCANYATRKSESVEGERFVSVGKSLHCGLQTLRSCLIARRDTLCCGLQLCCALMGGHTLSEQAMALALGVLQRAPNMQQEVDKLQRMHVHLVKKSASGIEDDADALAGSISKVNATAVNTPRGDVDATAEDVLLRGDANATADDMVAMAKEESNDNIGENTCMEGLSVHETTWFAARRAIACVGNREARERLVMGVSKVEGGI